MTKCKRERDRATRRQNTLFCSLFASSLVEWIIVCFCTVAHRRCWLVLRLLIGNIHNERSQHKKIKKKKKYTTTATTTTSILNDHYEAKCMFIYTHASKQIHTHAGLAAGSGPKTQSVCIFFFTSDSHKPHKISTQNNFDASA